MENFDLFTILPLAVAIFVFWKLRSVLGTRNGTEKPPFEPYNPSQKDRTVDASPADTNDNVVTLPGARGAGRGRDEEDPVEEAIARVAGKNKDVKKGLTAIYARDPSFDPDGFLPGAKIAYEMIVMAFADADKRALKGLLSREVYENFAAAIDERKKSGQRIEASFVGIEKAEIVGAEMQKDEAQITLRFVSQMISATLNADNEVVEGDQQDVAEITDVWTFARLVKSQNPNWKLVATDA